MSVIRQFEDIEGWKVARELTQAVYRMTIEGEFARDYGLKDQIRRASVSIMSNIAEGFGRGGNQEFVHFLTIARGSAAEVQAQLYVALDAGHISQEQFSELNELAANCGRQIGGLIRYLKQSTLKGSKHK